MKTQIEKKNEVSALGGFDEDQVNIKEMKYVMSLPEKKFYLKASSGDVEDEEIFHLKMSTIVIIVLNPP